jgi:ABC-type phosphate transport system ATPase subunit
MFEGSILEMDKPERIFTSPGHERTRQFLQSVL